MCFKNLFQEAGIEKSSTQISNKLKNLRREYNKQRSNNKKSGRGRQTARFYEKLDKILGCRPSSQPDCVLESSIGVDDESKNDDDSREDDDKDDDLSSQATGNLFMHSSLKPWNY